MSKRALKCCEKGPVPNQSTELFYQINGLRKEPWIAVKEPCVFAKTQHTYTHTCFKERNEVRSKSRPFATTASVQIA